MFNYKAIEYIQPIIDVDIIHEMCMSTILNYGTLNESDDGIDVTTTNISNKINLSMSSMIKTINSTTDNIKSFIESKHSYLSKLISINKDKLESIDSDKLFNITFKRIDYNIYSHIPSNVNNDLIRSYISQIRNVKISKDNVSKAKLALNQNTLTMIGEMLRVNSKISQAEFKNQYSVKFKNDNYPWETHLNKSYLDNLLKSINAYPKDVDIIRSDNLKLIKGVEELWVCVKNIFMSEYTYMKDKFVVTNNSSTQHLNAMELSIHNEYRIVLLNYIVNILHLYNDIFAYKMNVINEKNEYEQALLLKIINVASNG